MTTQPRPGSKNEDHVISRLTALGCRPATDVESRRLPITDWPWQTVRSRVPPTCDLVLRGADGRQLYVEVKGFMTIHAMAKLAWYARQSFPYYVLQTTEHDWDPHSDCLLALPTSPAPLQGVHRLRSNIDVQLRELVALNSGSIDAAKANGVTSARLHRYIATRIDEYRRWNGVWPHGV
jgi:hypothetical protein